MTTTDTIKALRDALELIRKGGGKEKSIDRIIFDVLALTADASEDAPFDKAMQAARFVYKGMPMAIQALDYLQAVIDNPLPDMAPAARPAPVAATPAPDVVRVLARSADDLRQALRSSTILGCAMPINHAEAGQFLALLSAAAPAAPIAEVPTASEMIRTIREAEHAKPEPVGLCAPFPGMGTEWTPEAEAKLNAVLAEYPPERPRENEDGFTPGTAPPRSAAETELNQTLTSGCGRFDQQLRVTVTPGIAHVKLAEGARLDEDALLQLVLDWERSKPGKAAKKSWNELTAFLYEWQAKGQQAGAVQEQPKSAGVAENGRSDTRQQASAVDAARFRWLADRFTGYDFYWGGKADAERDEDKGKVVIVFECGMGFRGGRDFAAGIDVALAGAADGDRRGPVEPHEPERRNGFDRRGRVAPSKDDKGTS